MLVNTVYIICWMCLSSGVVIFNKWILDRFPYPILLTTWHLFFASLATQWLASSTSLINLKTVKMTGRLYLHAVVPIGFCFSLSLMFCNQAYLYLSISFIQMLKAVTPVVVLLATCLLGLTSLRLPVLTTVLLIVSGVMISSYGEINFVAFGFVIQCAGIVAEATRLALVQYLLSSEHCKMDPLVSLYYFAPVCTAFNAVLALGMELPWLEWADLEKVGFWTLGANAVLAFGLNVSQVFVISKMSSLVLCLCGIPKAIMLVAASMLFWGTPVSMLQAFGFSISLVGLAVYSYLPPEKVSQPQHGRNPSIEEIDEEKGVSDSEEEQDLSQEEPMMVSDEESD